MFISKCILKFNTQNMKQKDGVKFDKNNKYIKK